MLDITLSTLFTYLLAAFAAGGTITGLLVGWLLSRRPTASVTVAVPEVHLPDALRVLVQQPPAPKSRGQLWQEVYNRTFGDAEDYGNTSSQQYAVLMATQAANAAVAVAFSEPPPPHAPAPSTA